MKDQEQAYLNKLFTMSSEQVSNQIDEQQEDVPLVDVPTGLSDKLYAIAGPNKDTEKYNKWSAIKSWPKFTAVAASLLMAVVVVQLYQQQQTLKQLEQAQSDLATALQYLGEANRITRTQMLNTLNSNMKKAAFGPVIEAGREVVEPTIESLESVTKTSNQAL